MTVEEEEVPPGHASDSFWGLCYISHPIRLPCVPAKHNHQRSPLNVKLPILHTPKQHVGNIFLNNFSLSSSFLEKN